MHYLTYFLLRFFGFFFSLLPYSALHALGRILGAGAYYCHRPFRKKALSNLAIAYGNTKSEKERKKLARRSFQNIMIYCLEFFRLKRSRGKISQIAHVIPNPRILSLLKKKQGVIFLGGHQSNWEIGFIAYTERFDGIAIGRPIKNKLLYNWILSIREMHRGKIVLPKNAIRAGMKALKEGKFMGIVGDQAFPDSPYSYPLLGTRAWTSTTPALLAYKTNVPISVATATRIKGKYRVSLSDPLWPDLSKPAKEEVPALMDKAMKILEQSIQKKPEEWMWIHDRWKQQGINYVKRPFRHGFILIVLNQSTSQSKEASALLRNIYPRSFLTFFIPKGSPRFEDDCTYIEYEKESDLFIRDFRFQMVLDFYGSAKLRRHFRKLGAVRTLHFASQDPNSIKQTLVKPECLTTVSF